MTSLSDYIFPRPRIFEAQEGSGAGYSTPVSLHENEALRDEGFTIEWNAESISIQYKDARGLLYANDVVRQMRRRREFESYRVRIEDSPDFAVRGFLLDIADDRVLSRSGLLRLVELMSVSRINQLELYVQHTFAYEGHEVVWNDGSPYTPEDIRWLDSICAEAGIDLVLNQNVLGHMERWLAHDDYRGRAECPDGFDRFGHHYPPTTLAPTTENKDFVLSLLDELLPLSRSKRVNIGADEPWELGEGVSRAAVEDRGLGAVYFDFISSLMKELTDRGYQVEFWADVFEEHADLMGMVPHGCIPIVWQYDAPSVAQRAVESASEQERARWRSSGADIETLVGGFRSRAKILTDAGQPFWVAPGTSTWRAPGGRIDNAIENMIDAAEVGLEFGSEGYINTYWSDGGGYDPFAVLIPPLVFGGAVGWCLAANRGIDLAAVLDRFVTFDATGLTGSAMVDIGSADELIGTRMLNESKLFALCLDPDKLKDESEWPEEKALDSADECLLRAIEKLGDARPAALDGDVVVRELTQAAELQRFGVELLRLGRDGVDRASRAQAAHLLNSLDRLLRKHEEVWRLRWREGGLLGSMNRLVPFRRLLVARANGRSE